MEFIESMMIMKYHEEYKVFDNSFPCDGATYGWKRIFLKNFLPSEDAPITDQTLKNEKCNTNTEESNYFWDMRPDIGLWDYFQDEMKRKEMFSTLQPNFDSLHNQSSSLARVFKVSILRRAAGTCVSRESA